MDVQRYKTHHTGPLYQWRATNKDVGSGSVSGTAICVSLCRVCDYHRGLYKILYQLWPNESNPTISEVKLYQQKKKKHTWAWKFIAISFPNPFYRSVLARCSRIDFLTSSLLAKFAALSALIRVFPGPQLKWFWTNTEYKQPLQLKFFFLPVQFS